MSLLNMLEVGSFKLLLKQIAKATMTPAEYEAFVARMRQLELRNLQHDFPEIWQRFSEKFNEIKHQISSNDTPETVFQKITYDNRILSHPKVFESFERHRQSMITNRPKVFESFERDGRT